LLDGNFTISFKADTNFPTSGDPCQTNLFSDSSKIVSFSFSLKTLSGLGTLY